MMYKKIADGLLVIVILSALLIGWRVGYEMGSKDEIRRIKTLLNMTENKDNQKNENNQENQENKKHKKFRKLRNTKIYYG